MLFRYSKKNTEEGKKDTEEDKKNKRRQWKYDLYCKGLDIALANFKNKNETAEYVLAEARQIAEYYIDAWDNKSFEEGETEKTEETEETKSGEPL